MIADQTLNTTQNIDLQKRKLSLTLTTSTMPEGVTYSLFPGPEESLRRRPSKAKVRSRTPSCDASRRTNSVRTVPKAKISSSVEENAGRDTKLPVVVVNPPFNETNAGVRQQNESSPKQDVLSPDLYSLPTPVSSPPVTRMESNKVTPNIQVEANSYSRNPPLPDLPIQALKHRDSTGSLDSIIIDSPTDPDVPNLVSKSSWSTNDPPLASSPNTRTQETLKMTPPAQTSSTFPLEGINPTGTSPYSTSSNLASTSPVTYPSIPKRLSSSTSTSPPHRSLTRSSGRTNISHRTQISNATSATLVGPSGVLTEFTTLSPLQERFQSNARPSTAPGQKASRSQDANELGFRSIFPTYNPNLPLTKQDYQPAYRPIINKAVTLSSRRDFHTDSLKVSNDSAIFAGQDVPEFDPPPKIPIRGSNKAKEKKAKGESKDSTSKSKSGSEMKGENKKKQRAKLVKKNRPCINAEHVDIKSKEHEELSTESAQTSLPKSINCAETTKSKQQHDIPPNDRSNASGPLFSLTPATDPKPAHYEPSRAGTITIAPHVRHYNPSALQPEPLPDRYRDAEGQPMVVHSMTVALGALAFVAGVGVEIGAGVLGKVGKKV